MYASGQHDIHRFSSCCPLYHHRHIRHCSRPVTHIIQPHLIPRSLSACRLHRLLPPRLLLQFPRRSQIQPMLRLTASPSSFTSCPYRLCALSSTRTTCSSSHPSTTPPVGWSSHLLLCGATKCSAHSRPPSLCPLPQQLHHLLSPLRTHPFSSRGGVQLYRASSFVPLLRPLYHLHVPPLLRLPLLHRPSHDRVRCPRGAR